MTPLLIFLSQLCVRGKPLRLSSLTDKPFFFPKRMWWGSFWKAEFTEYHRFRCFQAAKHVQSFQMWLGVCPDGGKMSVLRSNSNRQAESNSRMGRHPKIQGSLNLWQLYIFLKQERTSAIISDNWITSTNSYTLQRKELSFTIINYILSKVILLCILKIECKKLWLLKPW